MIYMRLWLLAYSNPRAGQNPLRTLDIWQRLYHRCLVLYDRAHPQNLYVGIVPQIHWENALKEIAQTFYIIVAPH